MIWRQCAFDAPAALEGMKRGQMQGG